MHNMKPWLTDLQRDITQQIVNQQLPHAMLVTGVKGAGKFELSFWLAQALVCQSVDASGSFCGQCKHCHLMSQQTHPDFRLVELNAASITVEQIRKTSDFLEKTAQLANCQVVLIQDADKMTESAANALLKTLEEPTANSFIILLANDQNRLLPTIISRCRLIHIRPPVGKALLGNNTLTLQDPFINLTYANEFQQADVFEQFVKFQTGCLEFLMTQRSKMKFLDQMKESEHSEKWLAKVLNDLIRLQAGWQVAEYNGVSHQALLEFSNLHQHQLWQSYQLVKAFDNKRATLGQFNREFGLEKLLIDIQSLFKTEYC